MSISSSPSSGPSSPTSAATPSERVPLSTLLAYGPPLFALSSLLFFVQFFFLKYATDVLLLAPATVGVIFALGRAWDAVSDPLVGTWSDRTRSRLGRRRPWMFAAVPLLAVTFALVWLPPEGLGAGARLVWATLTLFAFYTAFTAYAVPHQSLGAELTRDHHDRSRVFGVNQVAFTFGMLLAFVAIQFVNNAASPRSAAMMVTAVAAVMVVLVLSVPPSLVRERAEYQGRGAENPLNALRDVLSNPHARIVLFAQFVQLVGASVLGLLAPYSFQYVLKRPDMIATLPAVFVLVSIGSVPFWVWASRRFGKRNVWRISMVGVAFSFGSIGFVGEGQVGATFVIMIAAGFANGCGGAVGPSILADVIDYDEVRSGERKEGAYSAAWGFAIKVANAVMILVTGLVLDIAGFRPNEEQTEQAVLALRLLFGGVPFVMFILGAVVLGRFTLNEAEHAAIRAELDRRRGKQADA